MSAGIYALATTLLVQIGPYDRTGTGYPASPAPPVPGSTAAPYQVQPYPEEAAFGPGGVPISDAGGTSATAYATGGLYGEPMYPYDNQYPWMHGYFQEISPYSGFRGYRPYNYRHVLSQAQISGGWGMSPKMPYSQQFWHKYQDRAAMRALPTSLDNPAQSIPLPHAAADSPQPNRVTGPVFTPPGPAAASSVDRVNYQQPSQRVQPANPRVAAPQPQTQIPSVDGVASPRYAPWDLEHRGKGSTLGPQ